MADSWGVNRAPTSTGPLGLAPHRWALGAAIGAVAVGAVTLVTGMAVVALIGGLLVAAAAVASMQARPMGLSDEVVQGLAPLAGDLLIVVNSAAVIGQAQSCPSASLPFPVDRLIGQPVTHLFPRAVETRVARMVADADARPGHGFPLRTQVRTQGRWVESEVTVTGVRPGLVAVSVRDASQRSELESELMRQAYSDPLTGLANRVLFLSRVQQAVREATGPREVAVLFVDLDGFKQVNDTLGHDVGDQLLETVGRRLQECIREDDLVARLGGDEFAVLVTGEDADRAAIEVASRISTLLPRPIALAGRQISPGGSTGVAIAETGHETSEQLLRNADLAMYKAKAQRDSGFVRYEERMHEKAMARVQAESDLRQAIASGDLVLHYQPVVNLASGQMVGVEALVRWAHASKGLLSPASFIDLAEETGLVRDIGEWALYTAAADAARFQLHRGGGPAFHVSVNVSARQLGPGLIDTVRAAMSQAQLPSGVLMLEVTESVFADAPDEAAQLLRKLRGNGIKIALDDFGTGYSSLSYLTRLPVDVLKVDKSFVRHLGGQQRTGPGELTRTILQLCRSLHLGAIAEGVETPQQREALLELGCGFAQGFLFAAAMRADAIEELLAQGGQLAAPATPPIAAPELAAPPASGAGPAAGFPEQNAARRPGRHSMPSS